MFGQNIVIPLFRSSVALEILKFHCHSSESIHLVTQATTSSRLLYAASAWYGYTLAKERALLRSRTVIS